MELILVSGFLGSGKTTFITTLAKQLVEHYNQKVIFIVNDVGAIGIDSQLMKKLGTDVYELFGGCICCQLGNDLISLLEEVTKKIEYNFILMEASGIAEPDKIVEIIRNYLPQIQNLKVITLVDATRWLKMKKILGPLLTCQITTADLILVNKIDKFNTNEVVTICQDIKNLEPNGAILTLIASQEDEVAKITEVITNG